MPSKPPLERIATTSPERISGATTCTIASASEMMRARFPACCKLGAHRRQVQALGLRNRFRLEHSGDHDFIRQRQAVGQFVLKDVAAQSVRARLQNRPQARPGIARTQRLQVPAIAVG